MTDLRSRARGCLLGGALGDALGAPVEFSSLTSIQAQCGPAGVRTLRPAYGRVGAITDDTQMTLFTAEGLIRAWVRGDQRGLCHPPSMVHRAYLRWLATQGETPSGERVERLEGWLYQQRFLHARRVPGNTCLSALRSGAMGSVEQPLNDSKGCGGVMRVAPIGLVSKGPFELAKEVAALTHGHPSGYYSAAALAELVTLLVHDADLPGAVDAVIHRLRATSGADEVADALEAARRLARQGPPEPEELERLGGGWTGEEALGIAVAAALTADDFLSGLSLAVTHSGDSDSTGAICGNLLGAAWGEAVLPAELLAELEGVDVIVQLANDLVEVCVNGKRPSNANHRYPEL